MRTFAATSRPETSRVLRPAGPEPPPAGEEGGGGGDWVLLTIARDRVVAHLIEGRLAEESIEAVLDTSNPSPGAWLQPFGDPMAPVKILVHRHDLGRATLILHEVDHRPPDPSAPGSPAVRRMFWLVLLVVLTLAGLQILGAGPCVQGLLNC